ncbi:MAG: BrnA antitoxin family protein [Acidobacteriaceae bacterium]
MSKMVKQAVDLAKLPPLTARQRKELEALAAKPDSGIDVSDIPALGDTFWKNAVRNPFYKPTKTPTTVRVDSDVLLWLKSKGRGYQTKINAILREAMLREVAPEGRRASGRIGPRSKQ